MVAPFPKLAGKLKSEQNIKEIACCGKCVGVLATYDGL